MKHYPIALIFLTAHLFVSGADLPASLGKLAAPSADIEELKEELEDKVAIGSVEDNTVKNDAGEKMEVIRFYTNRDENCDTRFRMRVTVEIEDKEGNTYFASLTEPHTGSGDDFTGKEKWEFEIPHGDLKRPKLSAYAIQSGVRHNGTFIPIAEEMDDVDSEEEIRERSSNRIDMKCSTHLTYYYE